MYKYILAIGLFFLLCSCAKFTKITTTCLHCNYTGKNEVKSAWDFSSEILDSDTIDNSKNIILHFGIGIEFMHETYLANDTMPTIFYYSRSEEKKAIAKEYGYAGAGGLLGSGNAEIIKIEFVPNDNKIIFKGFDFQSYRVGDRRIEILGIEVGDYPIVVYTKNDTFHTVLEFRSDSTLNVPTVCKKQRVNLKAVVLHPVTLIRRLVRKRKSKKEQLK